MAYSAEISRRNPTCFVFLLDQSGSMSDTFAGQPTLRKADFLADVANRTLHDLVIRSAGQGEVLNRYDIAVLGYGQAVGPTLAGALAGRDLIPVSEIAQYPAAVEERVKKEPDGAGGVFERTVKFPTWLLPLAEGGTPMVQALSLAHQLLERWIAQHPTSYPPTVIHCTDGESTDGDPRPIADTIRSLATSDGNVLLFNCHISSQQASSVQFAASDSGFSDLHSRLLFSMSSQFPPDFVTVATQMGITIDREARGYVFNADPVALVHFFEIGTRSALMLR